jgi:prevent-host-death family protein
MEKTVSYQDAPERIGDLLKDVSDNGDRYVVEQDGVPTAVVVPFALYQQWKERRQRFFSRMRDAGDRAGLSEDEAVQRTDEAVDAIRSSS